jgi:uncharacterized SAM-binding protein YcdF (DUF218 family)
MPKRVGVYALGQNKTILAFFITTSLDIVILAVFFFILSKFFAFTLKPHIWVLTSFITALFFLWRKEKVQNSLQKAKKWLGVSLVLALITGNHVIVNELYLWWEMPPHPSRLHQCDTFPRTAVILGGYSHYNAHDDIFRLNDAGDRFMVGLQGLNLGKFDRAILSGGSSSVLNKVYYEAEQAKKYMVQFGQLPEKIISDDLSRNTHENAVYTKHILDSLGIQGPVLLVTSASHMYRSMKCFEKAQVPFIAYPVHHIATPLRNYNLESILIPNPHSMERLHALIHEWVGLLAYRISGKI